MKTSLTQLCHVLHDLAAALETGRAGEVLSIEMRLAQVVADARAAVLAGRSQAVPLDEVRDHVATVRDQMARCRRLGATVPALLSVMYPGQVGYGPAAGRGPVAPVRSALTQVI